MSSSNGFLGGFVDMSVPNVVVPDFEVLVSPRNPNLCISERPESTGVSKVFLRIARKSILFEQKRRLKLSRT